MTVGMTYQYYRLPDLKDPMQQLERGPATESTTTFTAAGMKSTEALEDAPAGSPVAISDPEVSRATIKGEG